MNEEQISGVVGSALSALKEEAFTILWLLLAGLVVSMCVVGFIRKFLPNVDGESPAVWKKRSDTLKKLGAISALAWTTFVEALFLHFSLGFSWPIAVGVGFGPGIVAAALNERAFKPVKFLWLMAMAKLKKKAIDAGVPEAADALDDTNYRKK